jgi:hypothetical protein
MPIWNPHGENGRVPAGLRWSIYTIIGHRCGSESGVHKKLVWWTTSTRYQTPFLSEEGARSLSTGIFLLAEQERMPNERARKKSLKHFELHFVMTKLWSSTRKNKELVVLALCRDRKECKTASVALHIQMIQFRRQLPMRSTPLL